MTHEQAPLVLIRGAGELASGIAHRLHRCGGRVVMTELPDPEVIRRLVAFAVAIWDGQAEVEEVRARRMPVEEAVEWAQRGEAACVAVVVDPDGQLLGRLSPDVLIDARMAKQALDTQREQAPVVIGVGPGFEAGRQVHFVVETQRGPLLGAVIDKGEAQANTGRPAPIAGEGIRRLVRAPREGEFQAIREIGALVEGGDLLGAVEGEPVHCGLSGVLRGLSRSGSRVRKGRKLADVDPRGSAVDPARISDKARAVAGGVLEALLRSGRIRLVAERETFC